MHRIESGEIEMIRRSGLANASTARSTMHSVIGRVFPNAGYLLVGVIAFVTYEHFKLHDQPAQSLASLVAAAGFGLAPLPARQSKEFNRGFTRIYTDKTSVPQDIDSFRIYACSSAQICGLKTVAGTAAGKRGNPPFPNEAGFSVSAQASLVSPD